MKTKICTEPYCRKLAKAGSRCYSCEKKRYAEAHPVKYAYQVLRQNARRRGKEFSLTFEQFEKFCYETDVLHGRGRSATSYHIDRIDDSKGYTIDNIQVLTNSENIQKENRRRKVICYDPNLQFGFMLETKQVPKLDTPF